jgi:hypothetical protein
MGGPSRGRYVQPAGDAPLDEIEQAIVDELVAITVRKIRAEAAQAATRREGPSNDDPSAGPRKRAEL